jgi:hypothetical protein
MEAIEDLWTSYLSFMDKLSAVETSHEGAVDLGGKRTNEN